MVAWTVRGMVTPEIGFQHAAGRRTSAQAQEGYSDPSSSRFGSSAPQGRGRVFFATFVGGEATWIVDDVLPRRSTNRFAEFSTREALDARADFQSNRAMRS